MPLPHASDAHPAPPQRAPGLLRLAMELRAPWELGAALAALPLLSGLPAGDGHPVLVLPGLTAGDFSTAVLRRFIAGQGYRTYGWDQGLNLGPRPGVLEACVERVRRLHALHGRRVSLVGWSLGGVFALHGAHEAPECVRQVITLGSPVNVDASGSQSPALVKAMYRLIAHPMGPSAHVMQPRAKKLREHQLPPVPLSCLYSLGDGVVPPQEATVDAAPGSERENIRVAGSHSGLGFNALVLAILADRLALPEGQWRPFKPAGVRGSVYRWLTRQPVTV